jgi:chromosome segregation ATPase
MPTTFEQTRSTNRPPSAPPNGECVLRVCNGEHQGKIVRLKSTKCTIGAGPECTLRLVAPGLKPLHCLLIAGSQGVAIRRWSDGTLLNGRSFDNAWLQTGDQLRVGPVELEWIGWEKPLVLAERFDAAEARPQERGHKPAEPATAEPQKQVRRQRARNLKQYKRLVRARARMVVLRRRAKKADRTIEKLNRKLGDLRNQLAALTNSSEGLSNHHAETIRRLDDDLRQQRQDRRSAESQFEAQLRQWNEERRRFESAVDSIGRQLSAEQENSAKLRATADHARDLNDQTVQQLRQASEGLATKQAEWQTAIRDLEAARNQATSLRDQIQQLQREMASQTESHRRQQEEGTATLREQGATLRGQLDQLQREMVSQTESHRHQQSESAATLRDQTAALRDQLDLLQREMTAQTESHRRQQGESAATLREQTATLRDQVDLLQREMASQTESHRRLQGESAATLSQYATELKELRSWWQEFTAESAAQASENVSVTKAQWESLSHQCDRLTEAKRTTEQSLATAESSLECANQHVAELTAQNETLEQESKLVRDDLQNAQELVRQTESALAELQTRHSQLAAESEAQLQTWNRERESSETELSTTQAAIHRLRVEWQTQKSLVEAGNARVAELESEAQSLREQIEALHRQSQVAGEELARSLETAHQAESALADLQTRHSMLLAAGDSDRQVLTREQEKIVLELSTTRSELERLRSEYQSQKLLVDIANTRVAQLEGESQSLREQAESLGREGQAAREAVQQGQQAQQQAESSLAELQSRYSQLQSAGEENLQAWNGKGEQLESQLAASKAEADRLLVEWESQKSAVDTAHIRIAQLEGESQSLREQAETLGREGQAAREAAQQCQQAQLQAESSFAELQARYSEIQAASDENRQGWNGQREQLESQLAAAKAEAERLLADWQSQKSLVETANVRIAQLENDARTRQLSLSSTSREAAMATELEQTRQSLRVAEEQRNHTLASEQSVKLQLDEASTRLRALQEQAELWQSQSEHGSQQAQAQQEQLESLQRCRESLDQRVADLTQEIEQARTNLDSATSEKAELAALCEDLRAELLRQKSEAEAASAEVAQSNSDPLPLSSDDSWQRKELAQLQQSLAGEREDLEHERFRLKEANDAWEVKLQQRSEELERWQADLHDSQLLQVNGGAPSAVPQQQNPLESSPENDGPQASGDQNASGPQAVTNDGSEKPAYENPLFQNPLFQEIAPEVDRRMGLSSASHLDQGFSLSEEVPAPAPETPAVDSLSAFQSPSGDAVSDPSGNQEGTGQPNGGLEEPPVRQNQTLVFDRSSIRVPIEQKAAEDENANGGNDVWQRLNEAGLLRAPEHKPEPDMDSVDSFQHGQDPSIHDSSSVRQSMPSPFGAQERPAASPPAQPAPFQPKMPAEDEEESIEDYMARLLKRVRGESTGGQGVVASAPVAAKPAVSQPSVATPTPVASGNTEGDSHGASVPVSGTVSAEEYLPKCQAPESQINMAAMRELAIHSARHALAASADVRRRKSYTFSVAGLIGCVVGAALMGGASFVTGRYDVAAATTVPCLAACYFATRLLPQRKR